MQEEARYSGSCDARGRTNFSGCLNRVYHKVTAMNAQGQATGIRQNNGIVATAHEYYATTGQLHE